MKLKRESERKLIWVCRGEDTIIIMHLRRHSWPISKTLLDASLWSKFNEMAGLSFLHSGFSPLNLIRT
ncbi:hypothetical protein C5167_023212 [Papaver somniferum]|uniref:Uncharacterized protein n=1 Tax=Papaver somniferum TaxID=3469 RepID=A0A4Y7JN38_PAPSO|nr:hypothetical protein C5167_023212 [Papaver somniferum]